MIEATDSNSILLGYDKFGHPLYKVIATPKEKEQWLKLYKMPDRVIPVVFLPGGNTSLEIAGAIFELAKYDEKLAEKIWEEGSDEVLSLAFAKTDKDALFWGEQTIERKNV